MKKLFKLTILLIVLNTIFLKAIEYKGIVKSNRYYCQYLTEKESPYIEKICISKIFVKYNIYTMMGEPVGAYSVKWEIRDTLFSRLGSPFYDENSPRIKEVFNNLVPISPTKFRISFDRFYGFLFDGGALKKSGQGYSFNTPGSPSWNDFIYGVKDENVAKRVFRYLGDLSFGGIDNLTFSGIRELNDAIGNTITYPLNIKVYGEKNSKLNPSIKILNRQISYYSGIKLNKGSYQIKITNKGYKPLLRGIYFSSKNKSFEFRLIKEGKKVEKKAQELDDMFSNIEEKNREDKKRNDIFSNKVSTQNKVLSLDEILSDSDKASFSFSNIPKSCIYKKSIKILGNVNNIFIKDNSKVVFIINGVEKKVYLKKDGTFKNRVILSKGNNNVTIKYQGQDGTIEHKMTICRSKKEFYKPKWELKLQVKHY